MTRPIQLYAPAAPHRPVLIVPGLLRRLGLRRSPFATMAEMAMARHPRKGTTSYR